MEAKIPEERKGFVRQARPCGNYFGSGCMAIECSRKMKCQVNGCGWKRHTMLHLVRKKNSDDINGGTSLRREPAVTREKTGAGDSVRCSATESGKKNVCLRIVPVVVKGQGQHSEIETNALLDPGSDVSLYDLGLMTKLGVDGSPK